MQESKNIHGAWLLFSICFLSGIFGGSTSILASAYLPDIAKEFTNVLTGDHSGQVGAWISFLFFVGWMLGGIGLGFASDLIGRRPIFAFALVLCGIGNLASAAAPDWQALAASRLLSGAGVGAILVVTPVALAETWSARTRAIGLGILSVSFPVGIIASGLITYFISDWKMAFVVSAVPALLAVPAWFLLPDLAPVEKEKNENLGGLWKANRASVVSGALIYGAMLIGLWAAFAWLPTWIQSLTSGNTATGQEERGISIALLGAGGILGGVASGFLANNWGRKTTQGACFVLCLLLSFLLFNLASAYNWLVLAGISLLGIGFGVSQGVLNTYIPELFPAPLRSAATGLCFNAARIFTATAVFFVGTLAGWFGSYGNAIFAFSLIYVPGFLALLFIRKSALEIS